MFYPLVQERVRVGDRADEYVVVRVDRAAHLADIHLLGNPAAIESNVPFGLLFAATDYETAKDGAFSHDGWQAANQSLLRSADAHMHRAYALLAELRHSLLATMEAIQASQKLIANSDRLIARAQTLGCGESRNGNGG
jgi:hypothetical protein